MTSQDGFHFTEHGAVLELDENLYPIADGYAGYSTPSAVVIDGIVHLFYDVAQFQSDGSWKQVALHHAYSRDGISNWVQDAKPIFVRSEFIWTRDEIRSPSVVVENDSIVKMWFAGHFLTNTLDGNYFGIGFANADYVKDSTSTSSTSGSSTSEPSTTTSENSYSNNLKISVYLFIAIHLIFFMYF